MNDIQIADIWLLMKEFIDKKHQDIAAERYVELLSEIGVSDKILRNVVGHDDTLDDAIEYHLTEEESEEYDNDDWNDDGE